LSRINMSSGACCPANSWPELKNPDYKPKGVVELLDEASKLEVYTVGEGDKCVIWNYDIFGFDGGRTRQMADFVADQGFLVIMPDYYRGTMCDVHKEPQDTTVAFLKAHSVLSDLRKDFQSFVLPYATKKGAKTLGTFGFCWGSVPVIDFSSFDDIKCGVSFHPSHPPIFGMTGVNEEDALKAVKAPQLLLPAGGDADSVKKGGLAEKVLGDKCTIMEFPEMTHGWSVRGDCNLPEGERDVKLAFQTAVDFLNKHL